MMPLLVAWMWLGGLADLGVQCHAESLNDQLSNAQRKIRLLQDAISVASQQTKKTKAQIKRIHELKKLQQKERVLAEAKIKEFESEINFLHEKRQDIEQQRDSTRIKIQYEVSDLMRTVMTMERNLESKKSDQAVHLGKRLVLSQWLKVRFKDFEKIRIQYEDLLSLELKILEEKSRLEELRSRLLEQESLLAFHENTREEMNEARLTERRRQLAEIERLRKSQVEIEKLLSRLQAKTKSDADQTKPLSRLSPTLQWKWPMKFFKVLTRFGLSHDEESGLKVFRKGVELVETEPKKTKGNVSAAFDGTVQFLGKLPGRGNVMILSHSGEFFSVYGQLDVFLRQQGDSVRAGDSIGRILPSNAALYFEIRSRNLALDPLKWLKEP